jgi:hypothetical protein
MHRMIMLFTADATAVRWAEDEVGDTLFRLRTTTNMRELLDALAEHSIELLVLDLDSLPAPIFELRHVRVGGWDGSIAALGAVGAELRRTLRIARSISRPLGRGALRAIVQRIEQAIDTAPMLSPISNACR